MTNLEDFYKALTRVQAITQFEEKEVEKNLRLYLGTRYLVDCRYRLAPIDYTFTIPSGKYQILNNRTFYDRPIEASGISVEIKRDVRSLYFIDRTLLVKKTTGLIVTLDQILIVNGVLSEDQIFKVRGQISPVDYVEPSANNTDLEAFLGTLNRLYQMVLYGTFVMIFESRGKEVDPRITSLYNRKKKELHDPKDNPVLAIHSYF